MATYSATHAYGDATAEPEEEQRDISATLRDEIILDTMRGLRATTLRAEQVLPMPLYDSDTPASNANTP